MGYLKLGTIFLAFIVAVINCQENANPTIPDHLIECYKNPAIYTRENRLPNTMRTLRDLIYKIERSPTGQNKDAREISLDLLHYFRLDGIQKTQVNTQLVNNGDILPFAPSGDEYYNHRVTLIGLLPQPGQSANYDYFNESLSLTEMCNLHFLLSHSIDSRKREGEVCKLNNIETRKLATTTPKSRFVRPRYYRDTRDKIKVAAEEDTAKRLHKKPKNKKYDAKKEKKHFRKTREQRMRRETKTEDVEIVQPPTPQENNKTSDKEQMIIGHEKLFGPGSPHNALPKIVAPKRAITAASSQILTFDYSDCPIENGAVYTPYGSVTAGTVIAGIAAGLNYQTIDPLFFKIPASALKGLEKVKIDNVWATTLGSEVAQLILSIGDIEDFSQSVGLRGSWNDVFNPKTYLLENANFNYLTDVELRGALDGLWLGQHVQEWSKTYQSLSLSQILGMYYSKRGPNIEPNVYACNRRDGLSDYAPVDKFTEQLKIFSLVMQRQRLTSVTITNFDSIVDTAVTNVLNYVPSIDTFCTKSSSQSSSKSIQTDQSETDNVVNVQVIVDGGWDYDSLKRILMALNDYDLVATPYKAVTTLLCGSDMKEIAVLRTSLDFESNDTADAIKSCGTEVHLDIAFNVLTQTYRYYYAVEKASNTINTTAQVSLFLLSASAQLASSSSTKFTREIFPETFPDVKFLVGALGSQDFTLITDVPDDVTTLRVPTDTDKTAEQTIQLLAKKMRLTAQRLSNPQCTSWYQYAEGAATVTDNVRPGLKKYYKLPPNYFYSSGDDAKIMIKSNRNRQLLVCKWRAFNLSDPISQNTDAPVTTASPGDDGNGAGCTSITTETLTIELRSPCGGYSGVQGCPSQFVSVTAVLEDPSQVSTSSDCSNCRSPDNVEYTIRVEKLSCDAGGGAATLIINPFTIVFALVMILMNERFFK